MDNLLEELKKRSIFKVAVAYILVGWILVQVAAAIESLVEMPDWFGAVVLAFIVIGFPVAMVLAWAYEVTPEGIKKTSKKANSKKASSKHSPVDLAIIVILLSALGYVLYTPEETREIITDRTTLPGIAVIPFENMSGNADNEQFTSGLHDDLLTQLSRINGLKVISRTSVLKYKNTDKSMTQIGEELGVETIIEGGVQRVDDHIRINVQLIDAKTDKHLWAETYDRKLSVKSIFEIQSEIAHKITDSLKVSITRREDKSIFAAPTKNMEAYEAYLRARELRKQIASSGSADSIFLLNNAIFHSSMAVTLDPEFGAAWAELASNRLLRYFDRTKNPQDAKLGKAAADRAKLISPDLPEVYEAYAYYHYYVTVDYDKALEYINLGLESKPNDLYMITTSSYINRRSGRFVDALKNYELWTNLDPTSDAGPGQRSDILFYIRRFREAVAIMEDSFAIPKPMLDSLVLHRSFNFDGNVEQYIKHLEKEVKEQNLPPTFFREDILFNASYVTPTKLFKELVEENFITDTELTKYQGLRAILYYRTGEHEKLKEYAAKTIPELKQQIEEFPTNFYNHYELSLLYVLTDDKEQAEKSIVKMLQQFPYEKDRFETGLWAIKEAFSFYAFMGEHEKSFRLLDEYLGLPGSESLARVKLGFTMDGMENWPGYDKLVATHGLTHKDYSDEPMLEFGERFSGYAFKKDEPIE
ncbi:MAG: hypothetical protein OEY19_00205 [Gammaproteobacteria bacterium]|nr:hypothetical protein [Gammaproteobacteria bacterium]MDH5630481.1 hypothetical protein [Gammaproteobacteria bacterium]